jgi:hypothetical protein
MKYKLNTFISGIDTKRSILKTGFLQKDPLENKHCGKNNLVADEADSLKPWL